MTTKRLGLLGLALFFASACDSSSNPADDLDAGMMSSVGDASYLPLPPSEDPCAGLFAGDPSEPVPHWDDISCVSTSTNPCDLFGLRSRQYKICYGQTACEGRCSCGDSGKDCVARNVTDTAPCMTDSPSQPLQTGPWSICNSSDLCSNTGNQSRSIVVCQGVQTATASESQMCERQVNAAELAVGDWAGCQYANTCVQTGTRTRQIEACDNNLTVWQIESDSCERSTEGLMVGVPTVGECNPVSILDCSPSGTRTSTFSECINGMSTVVSAADPRANESCELPTTQALDLTVNGVNANLELAQSQVEVSSLITAILEPNLSYDGVTRDFTYRVPFITSTLSISPKSAKLVLSSGLELNDEEGLATLVSPDGMSTGTIDYSTGILSVSFAIAPAMSSTTSFVAAGPRSLSVESSFVEPTLSLCRLAAVHGDLNLGLADPVTAVSLEQLVDVYGSLTIQQITNSSEKSYAFTSLERVRGDLRIESSYLADISMPLLQQIDGDLIISSNAGTSLSLPQLRSVKNLIVGTSTAPTSANSSLVRFDLPSLKNVLGNFVVSENPQLRAWSVDLEEIAGDMTITQTNTSSCTLFNTYVAPVYARQGIGKAISVQGAGGTISVSSGGIYPDTDGDGFIDDCDNCSGTFNASQTDSDGDGTGDECDPTPNG